MRIPHLQQSESITLFNIPEEALLTEARSWSDDETVNWSALEKKYGVTTANGGQSIKEFLRSHNIPAASKTSEQHNGRLLCRKRKVLPGGIPFPMQRHSSFHKKELFRKVQSDEIVEGNPVVPTSVSSFSYNKTSDEIVESTSMIYARKIPILDIRKKLLRKHETLGVTRNQVPGSFFFT